MALSSSSRIQATSFKEDPSSPYAKPLSMLERLSAELDKELNNHHHHHNSTNPPPPSSISLSSSSSIIVPFSSSSVPSSSTEIKVNTKHPFPRNEQWIPTAATVRSYPRISIPPYSNIYSNSNQDGAATPPRPESLLSRVNNNNNNFPSSSSSSSSTTVTGTNTSVPMFSTFTTTSSSSSNSPTSNNRYSSNNRSTTSSTVPVPPSLNQLTSSIIEKNQLTYPTNTIQGNTAAVHSYLLSSSLPSTYTAPLPSPAATAMLNQKKTVPTGTTVPPYNTSILSLNTPNNGLQRNNDNSNNTNNSYLSTISSILPKSVPITDKRFHHSSTSVATPTGTTTNFNHSSTTNNKTNSTISTKSLSSLSLLSDLSTPDPSTNQAAEALKLQLESLNKRIEQRTRKANPDERKALAMATRLAILEGTTTAILPITTEDLGVVSTVTSSKLLQQSKQTLHSSSNVNSLSRNTLASSLSSLESKHNDGNPLLDNGSNTASSTLIVPNTLLPDRRILPIALSSSSSSSSTVTKSGRPSSPLKTPTKHVTFDASAQDSSNVPPPPPPISPPRSLLKNYLGSSQDTAVPTSTSPTATNPFSIAKSYRQEMLYSSSSSSLTTPSIPYPHHRDGILASSSSTVSTTTGPVLSPTSLSSINNLDTHTLLAYSSLSDGTAPRAIIPLIHSTGGASALWPSLHGRSMKPTNVSYNTTDTKSVTTTASSSQDRLAQLVGSPLIRATRARVQATHRAGQILDRETARKRIFGALIRWIRRRLPDVCIKVKLLREKRLRSVLIIQRYVRGYRARELRRQLKLKAAQEKAILARLDKEAKYRIAETYDHRLEIALTVVEATRRFQEGSSKFFTPNTALINQSLGRNSIDNNKAQHIRSNSLLSTASDSTASTIGSSITMVNGVPLRKNAAGNYIPQKVQPLPSFVKLPNSAFTPVMKYSNAPTVDETYEQDNTNGNSNTNSVLDVLISQKLQPLVASKNSETLPSSSSVSPTNKKDNPPHTKAMDTKEQVIVPSNSSVPVGVSSSSTTSTATTNITNLTKLLKNKQANIHNGSSSSNSNTNTHDNLREVSNSVGLSPVNNITTRVSTSTGIDPLDTTLSSRIDTNRTTGSTIDPSNDDMNIMNSQRTLSPTTAIPNPAPRSVVSPLSPPSPAASSSTTVTSAKELLDKLPVLPKLATDGPTYDEKRLIQETNKQLQMNLDNHLQSVKTSIAAAALSSQVDTDSNISPSTTIFTTTTTTNPVVAKVIPAPNRPTEKTKPITTDSLIDSILDGIEAEALTGGTLEERLSRAFNNSSSNS